MTEYKFKSVFSGLILCSLNLFLVSLVYAEDDSNTVEYLSSESTDSNANEEVPSEAARAARTFLEKMRQQRGLDTRTQSSPGAGSRVRRSGRSSEKLGASTEYQAAPGYRTTPADLRKKIGDVDNETYLEEVLNASSNDYSLAKKGDFNVLYTFGYYYFDDDRIEIGLNPAGTALTKFLVIQSALATYSHTLTLDYGVKDNISFGIGLPIMTRRDSIRDLDLTALGDTDIRFRWQPWKSRTGDLAKTLFANVSVPTGQSPYEIDYLDELSSGNGYFSVGGGVNMSKVTDPVVLFGSASMDWNLEETGLDQDRGGGQVLEAVEPGMSLAFNLGMIYSVSYDVSLSFQYIQVTDFETTFVLNNDSVVAPEIRTSTFEIGTGLRIRPDMILSLGFGIGLTRNAQDFSLTASIPVNYTGFKGIPFFRN